MMFLQMAPIIIPIFPESEEFVKQRFKNTFNHVSSYSTFAQFDSNSSGPILIASLSYANKRLTCIKPYIIIYTTTMG